MQLQNTILTILSLGLGFLSITSQDHYLLIFGGIIVACVIYVCYTIYGELKKHSRRMDGIEKDVNYQKELIDIKTNIEVLNRLCK